MILIANQEVKRWPKGVSSTFSTIMEEILTLTRLIFILRQRRRISFVIFSAHNVHRGFGGMCEQIKMGERENSLKIFSWEEFFH